MIFYLFINSEVNKMSVTALEYAQKAEVLCVLPDVYLRLKEIMDDEESTLIDIANVLALDPSLSSKLLKLANSALFNFPQEIDIQPYEKMSSVNTFRLIFNNYFDANYKLLEDKSYIIDTSNSKSIDVTKYLEKEN